MKNRKLIPKPNQVKLLQGQSDKLKQKLQSLKQQIQLKKKDKQLNRTIQTAHRSGSVHQKPIDSLNSTTYSQKQGKTLQTALIQLKMEHLNNKLKDRNVHVLRQLLEKSQTEIDEWKEIPVGYKIRLKKYIGRHKHKVEEVDTSVKMKSQQTIRESQQASKDIQQIVRQRKNQQIYVALQRQHQLQNAQGTQQQLEEQQQEQMMLSLFQTLGRQHRKGCFKDNSASNKKQVNWSPEVEQMEKKHKAIVYPKQIVSKCFFTASQQKELEIEATRIDPSPLQIVKMTSSNAEQHENHKSVDYCWSCLKIVKNRQFQSRGRQFCGTNCMTTYSQQVNPVEMLHKFQQVQQKHNQMLQQFQQVQYKHNRMGEYEKEQLQIDLSF